MLDVIQSETFEQWFAQLKRKDRVTAARIDARVLRLAGGNPGDVRPIGEGLSELRFNFGPGWRVYYLQDGDRLILLLAGGDKSTQQKDINEAHRVAADWRAEQRKERDNG
jgi:putative addiction module killer protein